VPGGLEIGALNTLASALRYVDVDDERAVGQLDENIQALREGMIAKHGREHVDSIVTNIQNRFERMRHSKTNVPVDVMFLKAVNRITKDDVDVAAKIATIRDKIACCTCAECNKDCLALINRKKGCPTDDCDNCTLRDKDGNMMPNNVVTPTSLQGTSKSKHPWRDCWIYNRALTLTEAGELNEKAAKAKPKKK
jgi:hypothetical protein